MWVVQGLHVVRLLWSLGWQCMKAVYHKLSVVHVYHTLPVSHGAHVCVIRVLHVLHVGGVQVLRVVRLLYPVGKLHIVHEVCLGVVRHVLHMLHMLHMARLLFPVENEASVACVELVLPACGTESAMQLMLERHTVLSVPVAHSAYVCLVSVLDLLRVVGM